MHNNLFEKYVEESIFDKLMLYVEIDELGECIQDQADQIVDLDDLNANYEQCIDILTEKLSLSSDIIRDTQERIKNLSEDVALWRNRYFSRNQTPDPVDSF